MSAGAEMVVKQRHERRATAQLRRLFKQVAASIEGGMRASANVAPPDVRVVGRPNLLGLLVSHYVAVSRDFAGDLVRSMPDDVPMSDTEQRALAVALSKIFLARAPAQADQILGTAQDRLRVAVRRAAAAIAKPGSGLSLVDMPRVTAALWEQRQRIASAAIAQFETQTAAEIAKGVAVDRLVGRRTRELKADGVDPTKVWQSQGDARVRDGGADGSGFDHLSADGQRVGVDEAFTVSGEELRWPGDLALGASVGNVANCRCSALYDVESLAVLRRILGEEIARDAEEFVQTVSDVVVSMPFSL